MDSIAFITTEEAMDPVSNMSLSNRKHAVTTDHMLARIRMLLDQSALLAVADIKGTRGGELRVPQPFSRTDLEPRGQNMTICLLARSLQGVWTDWSRLLKHACALLQLVLGGQAMVMCWCVFIYRYVSKRVCLIQILISSSRNH